MTYSTESEKKREAERRKGELLRRLRNALKDKRLAIVVGAGVTLNATADEFGPLPRITWTGLIGNGLDYLTGGHQVEASDKNTVEQAYMALNDKNPNVNRVLDAANVMKSLAIKKRQFPTWLETVFESLYEEVREPAILDALKALNKEGATLLTTNYDDLLEKHCGLHRIGRSQKNDVIRFKRGDMDGVFHAHGSWKDPDDVVLDTRDYDQVINSTEVQSVLKLFLEFKIMLFVGCGSGLEDPNFDSLLKWASEQHKDVADRHCLLVRDGDPMNFTPLRRLEYGSNYSDLALFLNKLLDNSGDPSPTFGRSSSDQAFSASTLRVSSPENILEQFPVRQSLPPRPTSRGGWSGDALLNPKDKEQRQTFLILRLLSSIAEFYEEIPRALHRCIKYAPERSQALKDLRGQRASFRVEYRFLLTHLLDRATAEEILEDGFYPSRHGLAVMTQNFLRKLTCSIKNFISRLESMRRVLDAVREDIIGLYALIQSLRKRRWSSEGRTSLQDARKPMRLDYRRHTEPKISLYRGYKNRLREYLRQSTFDERVDNLSYSITLFSGMCSKILPFKEPENDDESTETTFTKPEGDLRKYAMTQKASVALYQGLRQGCATHSEHLAHINLETDQFSSDETTKVSFSLAVNSDVRSEDPIWIVVESVASEQTRSESSKPLRLRDTIKSEDSGFRGDHKRKMFRLESFQDGQSSKISKRFRPLLPKSAVGPSMPPSNQRAHSFSPIQINRTQDLKVRHSLEKQQDKRLEHVHQHANKCMSFLEESLQRSISFKHQVFFSPEMKADPKKRLISLAELIDISKENMKSQLRTLDRLKLARLVATAILNFNSTPWLEGPWCSEDVIFFDLESTNGSLPPPHLTVRVIQQQIKEGPLATKENLAVKQTSAPKQVSTTNHSASTKPPTAPTAPTKQATLAKLAVPTNQSTITKQTATTKQTKSTKQTMPTKPAPTSKKTASTKQISPPKESSSKKQNSAKKGSSSKKHTSAAKADTSTKSIQVSRDSLVPKQNPVAKHISVTKQIPTTKQTTSMTQVPATKQISTTTEPAPATKEPSAMELALATESISYGRNSLLFSLGVVLLELGYGKTFRAMHEASKSPSKFDTAMKLSKDMPFELGIDYVKVVQRCIECDFIEGGHDFSNLLLREVFYRDVVLVLAKLEKGYRRWLLGNSGL